MFPLLSVTVREKRDVTKTDRSGSEFRLIPCVSTFPAIAPQSPARNTPLGGRNFGASPLRGTLRERHHHVCALSYIALIQAVGSLLYRVRNSDCLTGPWPGSRMVWRCPPGRIVYAVSSVVRLTAAPGSPGYIDSCADSLPDRNPNPSSGGVSCCHAYTFMLPVDVRGLPLPLSHAAMAVNDMRGED
jgi:hypothetical protein